MRIGSRLSGADLAAQHHLMQAFARSQRANTRLATMIRINQASDDPAGLIAMEQLEAELTAIRAASDNAARLVGVPASAGKASRCSLEPPPEGGTPTLAGYAVNARIASSPRLAMLNIVGGASGASPGIHPRRGRRPSGVGMQPGRSPDVDRT
jgi:hypothetical protein